MEFFAFLGLALLVAIGLVWRSRARTTRDRDSLTKGMPDDLRDKNVGMLGLPNRGRPWR